MKQYTGGRGSLHQGLVSLANLQDYVLGSRVLEAEGCQQPRLMGKGSNEFLITETRYFSDLIFTDIGKEFS